MAQQEPASFELNDNSTAEEHLASLLIEEQRLRDCWLKAPSKTVRAEYQAQLKSLIQSKLALKSKIDTASLQKQQQTQDSSSTEEDTAPLSSSPDKPQNANRKLVYELGSTTPKAPAGRRKTIALAASLLIMTSAGVFISQSNFDFQQFLSSLFDQRPDQMLELETEVNELIAQLSKKETDIKENLNAATNDAEKLIGKKGYSVTKAKLNELQTIYDLSQKVIFEDGTLTDLQQKKVSIDLLIQEKQYQAAIPELEIIKQGYLDLLANLDEAKPLYLARNEALVKQSEWLDFKRKYELGMLKTEATAVTLLSQADTERKVGQLILALSNYQQTSQAYQNLLTGPEAREAIAARSRQAIIAGIKKEMIPIPRGDFRMGDLNDEGDINEKPAHKVTIAPFALKKTEVTFEQYDIFADATNRPRPDDGNWGRGDRPVINVSWHDAIAYTEWLTKETGDKFRLPTEAEWEYAARAERETKYSWGEKPSALYANGNEEFDWPADGYVKQTAPVASFNANDFGLHDMIGNVQEWTQDCWKFNYKFASPRGKAWAKGDCEKRVSRGGSWVDAPAMLRTSKRDWSTVNVKSSIGGFRLAQDQGPEPKVKPKSTKIDSAASE